MREALDAAEASLPLYAHRFAPKKFTQPQLFACLVLKEFERKDYRGVRQLLLDCADLREAIALRHVPHYTTFQKASVRLLRLPHVRLLLKQTVQRIQGRRRVVPYAATDSSGFDAHHASRYFIWRRDTQKHDNNRPKKRHSYKHYGKLMLIVSCVTHAILAAVASEGPTPDIDQLDRVVGELPGSVSIEHMLADAGFDSAHNHQLLHEQCGMRATIPPDHGRPPKDPKALPKDRYRRRMKTHFKRKAYRRRGQVETVFSMLKRNFGSALRAKTNRGRRRDMYLQVLAHNIAIVLLQVFYRAGMTPFPYLRQR